MCRQTAARHQQASLVARPQRQTHAPQRTGTGDGLGEDVHTPGARGTRSPGRHTPTAVHGRQVPGVCVSMSVTVVCSSAEREQGRGGGMRAHPAQAREGTDTRRGGIHAPRGRGERHSDTCPEDRWGERQTLRSGGV